MPRPDSKGASPIVLSIGLFVVGVGIGGIATDRLIGPEASGPSAAPPTSHQEPPGGTTGRDATEEAAASGSAERDAAPGVEPPDDCPPETRRDGFVPVETPWDQIGVTSPLHLFKSLGEEGRAVAAGVNATFDGPETFEALGECHVHLRPPPGDPVEAFKCNVILDLQSANGELRLVGGEVRDMTFADNQIERCLRDLYLQPVVVGGPEGLRPKRDFRIRVSWPIRLGLPGR